MDSGYKLAAVFGGILGTAAMLVSIAALGSGAGRSEATSSAAAQRQLVDVELGDLFIKPGSITLEPGADVTFRVRNGGGLEHDLRIEGGPGTPKLAAGQTSELHLGTASSALTLYCSLPGHRDAGMEASVAVAATSSAPVGDASHAAHKMTAKEMDASYLAGLKSFPAATKGLGNQLLQPTVQNNVKVFELTADEIDWEVAPGDVRKGMAYNGQIPGPMLRANLGDRVRIVFHNKLEESTALHYHGLIVPNDQDGVPGITQPLVEPGQSYTYEFAVRNSGTHMYHSHMNAAEQVPMGLLGAFVVAAPNEPAVGHDEVMVLNDGPLGYTINGKGFPATQPIVAKPNEVVRIRYMNEGSQIHPMHLHGMPQTVIALDGWPVPQPYLQDTVMVAPGQRVDVLITASELGTWAFHCHILSHAETAAGMFGMVTVLVVK